MHKRTTVEIDEHLLARAKRALGCSTTRATVEAALRLAAGQAEQAQADRAAQQRRYLTQLSERVDIDLLASDKMWR